MDLGHWLTIGGAIIQILVLGGTGIWRLAMVKDELKTFVTANRKDIDLELDAVRREIGETILAIRTKIGEVELWGRDNFVRQDSFQKQMTAVTEEVRRIADRMDNRFDQLGEKIDDLQNNKRNVA